MVEYGNCHSAMDQYRRAAAFLSCTYAYVYRLFFVMSWLCYFVMTAVFGILSGRCCNCFSNGNIFAGCNGTSFDRQLCGLHLGINIAVLHCDRFDCRCGRNCNSSVIDRWFCCRCAAVGGIVDFCSFCLCGNSSHHRKTGSHTGLPLQLPISDRHWWLLWFYQDPHRSSHRLWHSGLPAILSWYHHLLLYLLYPLRWHCLHMSAGLWIQHTGPHFRKGQHLFPVPPLRYSASIIRNSFFLEKRIPRSCEQIPLF